MIAAGRSSLVVVGFMANERLCTFAELRLDPDVATVHFHDLLGKGEPQLGGALGLGVGTVDLVRSG